MVGFSTSGSGRFVDSEWHEFREKARTETYGIFEWGDIAIENYDLDTVEFDRAHKETTFITESQVEVEGGAKSGFDVRDLPTHD